MDCFMRLSLLVLTLGVFADLSEARCQVINLNSNRYRYNRVTVSGAAEVTSINVVNQVSNSACTPGVSFGSYGPDVWVNLGCRARFNVCYTSGTNTEVTCSSNGYRTATCSIPGMIRSVAVKQHLSSSPCVQGVSFKFSGRGLQVLNGCRARFVVGYTD